MNKKAKVTTVAMLLVGMLAACTTAPKNTAMEQQRRQAVTNYGTTNYVNPNTVGYVPSVPPAPVTDQYVMPSRVSSPNYGDVRYSKINQDIHRKRNDVGYNYYDNRYAYPTPRNVTMPGTVPRGNPNVTGQTADDITNRVVHINGVDKVATIIQGNDVLIAVKARNKSDEKRVEDDINRNLVSFVVGRKIHVIADETTYNRVNSWSTHLRNGTLSQPERTDMDNMFHTFRTQR